MIGSATNDPQQIRVGTLLAGKFEVLRELGRGGMGAVYEVNHRYTGRQLALKLLLPEHALNESHTRRFLQEASVAGRTDSDHIVKIFDADRLEDGTPYLVMELLEGRSLEAYLTQAGPDRVARRLPPRTALQILRQACLGVQAAHDVGIIHRDIKPGNLFVESVDPPRVKVVDFGISRFAETQAQTQPLTAAGSTLGTPRYMSPEHMLGEELSFGTDVFSLGVVLYEALTGRLPFLSASLEQLLKEVQAAEFPLPSVEVPGVPPFVDGVVTRALAAERSQRYQTAAELAEGLSEALRNLAPGSEVADVLAPTIVAASASLGSHGEPLSRTTEEEPVVPIRPLRSRRLVWLAGAVSVGLGGAGAALLTRGSPDDPGSEASPAAALAAPSAPPRSSAPPKSTTPASPPVPVSAAPPQQTSAPEPVEEAPKPAAVRGTPKKKTSRARVKPRAASKAPEPAKEPTVPKEPKVLEGERGRIYNDFD